MKPGRKCRSPAIFHQSPPSFLFPRNENISRHFSHKEQGTFPQFRAYFRAIWQIFLKEKRQKKSRLVQRKEEEGEQIKVFTDITVIGGRASYREAAYTVSAILKSFFLFVKQEVRLTIFGERHLVPVLIIFATYVLFVCARRSSLLFE